MKKHKCLRNTGCICSTIALEPNEECPVHGYGEWPPRCYICGRFMKIKRQKFIHRDDTSDIKKYDAFKGLYYNK